jgi:hypothetical protein
MFKLTREEQLIIAFLLLAVLAGTAIREWRMRHPKLASAAIGEIKGH